MYGYLHDLYGTSARTFASIPKHDWCRLAFIVNEYTVNLTCLSSYSIKTYSRSLSFEF